MAKLPHQSLKNRYTFTISLFLLLFLLSIFFFNERALEPTFSLYRDLDFKTLDITSFFPIPITNLRSNNSVTISDLPVDSEALIPETESVIVPNTQSVDLEADFGRTNSEVSVKEHVSSDSENKSVVSTIGDFSIKENVSSISDSKSVGSEVNVGSEEEKVSSSDNSNLLLEKVKELKKCDLYRGKWVRDEAYPIYQPGSCPYVDEGFSCQDNGRPDSDYLKWRWKPDGCDLPRFNATDFLERLRGRRLMLVGDSMNRNQFESILCMLREGLSNKSRMLETHGYKITKGRGYYIFKFLDYNCTVEFVRSHFLVKEGIRLNAQRHSNPTLSIDLIDKSARRWKRADILVFNTGHWWIHGKTARGKNYFKEGDYIYPQFDAIEAYRRAMTTWGRWIDNNVNPAKKLVFYRGYSSAHFRGGDWDSGGSCNGETEPILNGSYLDNYPSKMKIVEEIIHEMKVPVLLLNVTKLTNYRKDGHPSIYRKNPIEGRKLSTRRQDCSHWCLPGVPDAWNELIYANLVLQQTGSL